MKRTFFLLFWIAGILFPAAWFVRFSPSGERLFNALFGPAWMHVAMHSFLYGVLAAVLLTSLFPRPNLRPSWQGVARILGLVLAVALLQESIQLLSQQRTPGGDELFDLDVDLAGAGLGMFLARRFLARSQGPETEPG